MILRVPQSHTEIGLLYASNSQLVTKPYAIIGIIIRFAESVILKEIIMHLIILFSPL